MPVPERIPVRREAGYHTDQIGRYGNGNQYIGFVFFLEREQRSLVSVLHLFDAKGAHLASEGWEGDPERALEEAIAKLANARPGDVSIRPFSVELLGTEFGLVQDGDESVEYRPYGLAFFPPWDGTYDT